jgi:zinc transport system permease protein
MVMITELLQYDFILRGFAAGLIVGIIAPLIGVFLILRRYSLIADTFAHVSLAGIAFALLVGINPIIAAVGATLLASVATEKLRDGKRVYGESALALMLSGSLALAVILIGVGEGPGTNINNYLFGSILMVTLNDIFLIGGLALVVALTIIALFKELIYASFDEEAARASGIHVKRINFMLILATALMVAIAIPIVGVLLISALIVIPAVTALLLRRNFLTTIIVAEIVSITAIVSGVILSFSLDIPSGGTIVMMMLLIFLATLIATSGRPQRG